MIKSVTMIILVVGFVGMLFATFRCSNKQFFGWALLYAIAGPLVAVIMTWARFEGPPSEAGFVFLLGTFVSTLFSIRGMIVVIIVAALFEIKKKADRIKYEDAWKSHEPD